ncbi:hypothetical protein GCM10007071_08370 [Marinobacter zhanjiangensis]|uniref:Uncharacterized protein n=1 Tax=Marinobacter zhanjiangensis TaxID=578215 RepID=A0ABQ3AU40_9GAMM|nr:hypothetical protein GCM10007071_08370 [Marinobacter zhanjiangensis]
MITPDPRPSFPEISRGACAARMKVDRAPLHTGATGFQESVEKQVQDAPKIAPIIEIKATYFYR